MDKNNIEKISNNLKSTNSQSDFTLLKNLKLFVNQNKVYIILFILIIVVIIVTYYYSEFYRPKNRLKKILNGITYKQDREQIDFCGNDNYVKDKIYSNVSLNKNDNSITFLNPNINLYSLGLSSEYFIDIKKSKAFIINGDGTRIENVNDNPNNIYYKILRVVGVNKLIFQNDESSARINEDEINSENVVISYFRPAFSNNIYKNKPLTDYYICSSFNSFLIGNQKADYCDVNMIKNALYFGARYIELQIMNKDMSYETDPIVCVGIEKGNIITSLNHLELQNCLNIISKHAFSENFLSNFNDPLFLFLNLKTNDNYVTLDKIYELIKQILGIYLLDKSYNHVDISKLNLCELREKLLF
jgi:hypothetical protein